MAVINITLDNNPIGLKLIFIELIKVDLLFVINVMYIFDIFENLRINMIELKLILKQ